MDRELMQDIKRAAYEAKAREMRAETERRSGGRLSPSDREAVDSVLADIVEEAAEPPLPRHGDSRAGF